MSIETHPDHSPVDTGRFYACIDLRSFYASAECVAHGLDSLTTNLVVADPARGGGAICLAVSTALKALGVRNRCRVYEIPANIKYITAVPRMRLYMKISADIYSVYLRYVSKEDIFPYSIDECFIDMTPYLRLYGNDESMGPRRFAQMLMDAVYKETGIASSAGVGTNLFLAKIALDITAKHSPDHIGYLDEETFQKTLWRHRPLTDFWNIGAGITKRLEKHGIYDLYTLAHYPEETIYREFGVNAEYLIDHAWGYEPCTMAEILAYQPDSKSLSNGQILFENYNREDALTVMKEMVDELVLGLVEKEYTTNHISLSVGYSKECRKPTGGSRKLGFRTNSERKLMEAFVNLYEETTDKEAPIRRLNVGFGNLLKVGEGLEDDVPSQLDLFSDYGKEEERIASRRAKDEAELRLQNSILAIRNRYGKNAVLRGSSYSPKATGRDRNKMVGGHKGGEDSIKEKSVKPDRNDISVTDDPWLPDWEGNIRDE